MARPLTKSTEITEAKIRQVIWMLEKANKTKKECCEHLGIAYNTKRLQTIIDDFRAKQDREAKLKKLAKTKVFTDAEKNGIVKAYLNGETQTGIARQYHVSPQRIKKILIEMNVPIRARSKKAQPTVDHVVQNLDVKFNIGDKVFLPRSNDYGVIEQVFDEDYIEYLREPRRRKYVELHAFEAAKKKHGEEFEGKEDVHWNIYWEYDNGSEWKEFAIKEKINKVESIIEETGREYYRIWIQGDHGHFTDEVRHNLYPVVTQ